MFYLLEIWGLSTTSETGSLRVTLFFLSYLIRLPNIPAGVVSFFSMNGWLGSKGIGSICVSEVSRIYLSAEYLIQISYFDPIFARTG